MYPRVEFEMTENDLKEILDACKPVPYIVIGGIAPSSPQENANRAWSRLGVKMGFDYTTVRPVDGKGTRFFTAVPSETEQQKAEREAREAEEKKAARIAEIRNKIAELSKELEILKGE